MIRTCGTPSSLSARIRVLRQHNLCCNKRFWARKQKAKKIDIHESERVDNRTVSIGKKLLLEDAEKTKNMVCIHRLCIVTAAFPIADGILRGTRPSVNEESDSPFRRISSSNPEDEFSGDQKRLGMMSGDSCEKEACKNDNSCSDGFQCVKKCCMKIVTLSPSASPTVQPQNESHESAAPSELPSLIQSAIPTLTLQVKGQAHQHNLLVATLVPSSDLTKILNSSISLSF
jgi:hypothetical protein